MKDGVKFGLIFCFVALCLLLGFNALTNAVATAVDSTAASKVAEGQRAVLEAEAQVMYQASLAVRDDRLTAHAELYEQQTPVIVWILTGFAFAVIVLLTLIDFALYLELKKERESKC